VLCLTAAHGKLVTAIAADRAGARLLTGGEDYAVQMFDFGGMKRDMRSFRKLEPTEGYPINALTFSPSGRPRQPRNWALLKPSTPRNQTLQPFRWVLSSETGSLQTVRRRRLLGPSAVHAPQCRATVLPSPHLKRRDLQQERLRLAYSACIAHPAERPQWPTALLVFQSPIFQHQTYLGPPPPPPPPVPALYSRAGDAFLGWR